MNLGTVNVIVGKNICPKFELFAAIYAVSAASPVLYDGFRRSTTLDVVERQPIVGNVIRALASVS